MMCIAAMSFGLAEFSQAGYCLPIDRFLEADDVDLDKYSQGYVDAYTFQGKMWGMPWYGAVGQLYYRTDIIDTPPATWDELIEMAKAHMGGERNFGRLFDAGRPV